MPHAPAALPLRKAPLLCCWWELNASRSTVTLLSVVLQYLQLKSYSYEQMDGFSRTQLGTIEDCFNVLLQSLHQVFWGLMHQHQIPSFLQHYIPG